MRLGHKIILGGFTGATPTYDPAIRMQSLGSSLFINYWCSAHVRGQCKTRLDIHKFEQRLDDQPTNKKKSYTQVNVNDLVAPLWPSEKITSANYQIMLLKPSRVNPVWKP